MPTSDSELHEGGRPFQDPRRFELRCQAYPELWLNGRLAPLKLKRGLALLVCMSELNRRVSRAQLAELLWPDAPVETGRGRLRRLCHQINSLVGEELLVGDTDAVWLADTAQLLSDVAQVRKSAMQLIAAPADVEARTWLEILSAPNAHQMLEGFSLDADTFSVWLDDRRADQERLVIRALGRGIERMLSVGSTSVAAEAAAALIRLEPLGDTGHVMLMAALAQAGNGAGVDAAYHSCAELLRDELGVRPSLQIEAAYAEAVRQLSRPTIDAVTQALALPQIRFADTADGTVAFLELGSRDAPCGTLVIFFGLWSHIEVSWEEPRIRAILMRLCDRFHVVLMDRRGVGLSERLGPQHSLDAGVEDLDAVRRCLGVNRIWLLGNSVGGTIAIEYTATHAQHVAGLILYGSAARSTWAEDYPWGPTAAQLEIWLNQLQSSWGSATSLAEFAPSMADDEATKDWWARMLRQAASRNSLPSMFRAFASMDVRDRLSRISVPTLIVQRVGDCIVREGAARYMFERIQGAQLAVVPGDDHLLWTGNTDAVIACMEAFVDKLDSPNIRS